MIRRSPARAAFLVVLGLSSSGCFLGRTSVNQPLDPRLLTGLVPGESTAGDVTRVLGGPTRVVQLGATRTAYLYEHQVDKYTGLVGVVVNLGNADRRSDRVWVFFDEEQVLTHYGATFAAHRTQYAMPWEDMHEPANRENADRRRPGLPPGNRVGG